VLVAHIQDAKVRPLAVTGAARSPQLPDVPTMIESGLAGFTSYSWPGILAPAGTSPEIVDRLNAAINQGLKSPAMNSNLMRRNRTRACRRILRRSSLMRQQNGERS
jgi:tripartite-type tricarboxylate transporter receptor subunit TctC